MKPAETINKTPGNNCCHGASLKKIQPNKNEDGIPKYSKEASLLNEVVYTRIQIILLLYHQVYLSKPLIVNLLDY